MNEVKLIGNSGADAEIVRTQKDFPILNLSIATSKRVKDTNNWDSTWHRVVVLGKTAESIAPQIKKGSRVFINGELQNREWTDKQGNKRTTTEIIAHGIYVLEKPTKQASEPVSSYAQSSTTNFDDIPF